MNSPSLVDSNGELTENLILVSSGNLFFTMNTCILEYLVKALLK
jgi:hypothetical protein